MTARKPKRQKTEAAAAGAPPQGQRGDRGQRLHLTLGLAIKKARLSLGWTQLQLGKETGLSLKYVGEIERGVANTTLGAIDRIAEALNWDPLASSQAAPEHMLAQNVRHLLSRQLRERAAGLTSMAEWLDAIDPAMPVVPRRTRDVSPGTGPGSVEVSARSRPRARGRTKR